MQAAADVDLKPLRQPIRWRDLFFTRNASPILDFARTSSRQKFAIRLASLVALLPIVWLYRLYWSQKPRHGVEDVFAFCVVASWLALEGICLLSGLRLGWMASPAARRRRYRAAVAGFRIGQVNQPHAGELPVPGAHQ